MAVKLFLLGRPGSGKSSAARLIVELAKHNRLSVERVNDFCILQEMCYGEHQQKFKLHEGQPGFDVQDFSVLDIALGKAEEQAREAMKNSDIVIIEFARDNYRKALNKFNASFLEDAYFIFVDSNVNTCIERIHRRVDVPSTSDDYPVSDKILRSYYKKRVFPLLLKVQLVFTFALSGSRVRTIKNSGPLDWFLEEITSTFHSILESELNAQNQVVLQPSTPSAFTHAEKVVKSVAESATKVRAMILF